MRKLVQRAATMLSRPAKRSRKRRTPAGSAGETRVRLISPLSMSNQSAVICARC